VMETTARGGLLRGDHDAGTAGGEGSDPAARRGRRRDGCGGTRGRSGQSKGADEDEGNVLNTHSLHRRLFPGIAHGRGPRCVPWIGSGQDVLDEAARQRSRATSKQAPTIDLTILWRNRLASRVTVRKASSVSASARRTSHKVLCRPPWARRN